MVVCAVLWCARLKMNGTLISSLQFLEAVIMENDGIYQELSPPPVGRLS